QYTLDDWVPLFTSLGYRIWEHACFLWENHGYKTFEDFLACFSKNQRRNIRREEQKLAERGITLSVRAGEEIPSEWSALMYSFYYGTNVKFGPWSCLYLTPAFFEGVFLRFRHRLVMVAAHDRRTPDPVGMAMFLRKGQRLWGRYWGSHAYIPHLHFNVCYYTPIRWAIAQGIRYFDPGIGSEHKARRGFVSRRGYSLHHFFDPRLQALFDDNIGRFNQLIREQIDDQNLAMPLHSARPENHGGHHACFREVRKP
ncbi:MAG TPA: GNAT family N-acetyltransferase, partial [Spirochaetia bacterium]|nr:GNAT family N-acetyltransferase [Spirochaetia bacterium]